MSQLTKEDVAEAITGALEKHNNRFPAISDKHMHGLSHAAEFFSKEKRVEEHYADHRYMSTFRKITTGWFWKFSQIVFWLFVVWLFGEKLGIKLISFIAK